MPERHGGRVSLRGSYCLSRLALATMLRIPRLLRVHAIVVVDGAGRCLGEAQLAIRGQIAQPDDELGRAKFVRKA